MEKPVRENYPEGPAGTTAYNQAKQRYQEYLDAQDEVDTHNEIGAGRELDETTEATREATPIPETPEESTAAPEASDDKGPQGKKSGPKEGEERPWWYDDTKDDYTSDGGAGWGQTSDDITKMFPEVAGFEADYIREMQKAWNQGREQDFNDLKYAARQMAYGTGGSRPGAARATGPKPAGDYSLPSPVGQRSPLTGQPTMPAAPAGGVAPNTNVNKITLRQGGLAQPTGGVRGGTGPMTAMSTSPGRTLEELISGMTLAEKERWARDILAAR